MRSTPRLAAVLLIAVFALTSCGGGGDGDAKPKQRSAGCKDEIAVQAVTLPSGFSRDLKKGPGGGKDTPKDAIAYHWEGPDASTYIDVFRGSQRNKIVKGQKIDFLGKTGRIKEIGGGLAAKVKLARGTCTRYQFEAFKVGADDFKTFLRALKRTPGSTDEE
jgi:hypothetical protein